MSAERETPGLPVQSEVGGSAKTAPPLKPPTTEVQKRTLRTTGGKDGMNGERNTGCHLRNGLTFQSEAKNIFTLELQPIQPSKIKLPAI